MHSESSLGVGVAEVHTLCEWGYPIGYDHQYDSLMCFGIRIQDLDMRHLTIDWSIFTVAYLESVC